MSERQAKLFLSELYRMATFHHDQAEMEEGNSESAIMERMLSRLKCNIYRDIANSLDNAIQS